MPLSVELEDLSDEDEFCAKEMWARDQMRWLKAKRNHNEKGYSEDDTYDVDYGDKDADDVDYGDDETDDSDDSEDVEDAQELRFKTYPKGFKIEVCSFHLLGSMVISSLAV